MPEIQRKDRIGRTSWILHHAFKAVSTRHMKAYRTSATQPCQTAISIRTIAGRPARGNADPYCDAPVQQAA